MTWKKITQSFDVIVATIAKCIKDGDIIIEKLRCVYSIDDSNIIYNLSALDFADLKLQKEAIKKITLYQLID